MHKLIISALLFLSLFSPVNIQTGDIPLLQEQLPYVSYNGYLKVFQDKLLNQYNQQVQLKGISTHGLQWYGNLMNYDNMKYLKDNWNINVIRIAMYTEENGYIQNKDDISNKAIQIIENAIDLDLYVIIDWHILSDNDPNIHKEEAKDFFNIISFKYKDTPNVIYEICNEPNGSEVSWNNHIKPYAEEIIPIIRNNSPKSIIIVGTPNWCLGLDKVINNKLDYYNILYSVHFYSGSHKEDVIEQLKIAKDNKLPVFVSEWGTTNASGNGEIYEQNSREIIDLINQNNLSWINWSFCNKAEGSAILTPDYTLGSRIDDYLTDSGKLVKELLNK